MPNGRGRDHKLDDLPAGTMSALNFAKLCGVPANVAKHHWIQGVKVTRDGRFSRSQCIMETTQIPVGAERTAYYLTPEQQRRALAFWDRHNVPHRKPESIPVIP